MKDELFTSLRPLVNYIRFTGLELNPNRLIYKSNLQPDRDIRVQFDYRRSLVLYERMERYLCFDLAFYIFLGLGDKQKSD